MAFKLNRELLPVKAHFFLFFAALGPILPQLNVFGRQLGVSPGVMGMVTAVLPLLWAAAKPLFGYLVDYFVSLRKLIFMMLITLMTVSYCCLWFLPTPTTPEPPIVEYIYHLNDTVYIQHIDNVEDKKFAQDKYNCHWNCLNRTDFDLWLTNTSYISTIFINKTINKDTCGDIHMDFNKFVDGFAVCTPKPNCDLLCKEDDLILDETIIAYVTPKIEKRAIEEANVENNIMENNVDGLKLNKNGESLTKTTIVPKRYDEDGEKAVSERDGDSFYASATFWGFVFLMCIGTVAFNVANCIGDAVCFDVLGPERGCKYGGQRAWGTVGYGVTALLGGWLVHSASNGHYKDFTPAFVLALSFTALDLIACRNLKLPSLSSPSDFGAVRKLLRMPPVIVFITFAVVAGTFDSFIIYYMFWYLEELAEITGHMGKIKLIEGVVVAAQSVGELILFFFSGKILRRWGHGTTMTFCLFCYALRLAFISFISHPWHVVFIEILMQGPTYALCYATIVSYAAKVAPEGYSATVQGIVAGMDDGLGFAIGSLLGGLLYSYLGGCNAFRLMALIGLLGSFTHALLFKFVSTQKTVLDSARDTDLELTPEEAEMMIQDHQIGNGIYRDTVVPLNGDNKKPIGTNNRR